MDAKQAIEYLKCDGAFMISEKGANEIASLIESLARDAALGRAAVEAMDKQKGSVFHLPCTVNHQKQNNGIGECCLYGCIWKYFCRLRAGKEEKGDIPTQQKK